LLTISNIRNLRQVINQKYQKMKFSFEYNPAKDPLFKEARKIFISEGREEGREEGIEEGREEGIEEGREKEREKFLFNMFQLGTMQLRDIALIVGMPIDYVVEKKAFWDKQNRK
jgi:predicted transposase YdaD